MVEMKHILEKCRSILDQQQLVFAIEMISLKVLSDQFEKERIEVRNDFLVRGICEKEVDGLIEEPTYYKTKFIPKNARWNYLKLEKRQLAQRFQQALKELVPAFDKMWEISDYTVASIMNILDLYEYNSKTESEKSFEIQQLRSWLDENNIDITELFLYNVHSNCY